MNRCICLQEAMARLYFVKHHETATAGSVGLEERITILMWEGRDYPWSFIGIDLTENFKLCAARSELDLEKKVIRFL